MSTQTLVKRPDRPEPCIVLIGMAGTGKTTIGGALAAHLGYAFADTDHLMEAAYGVPLQAIADALDREAFLDLEARFVGALRLGRTVIATGGSVVYRDLAMQHLKSLGPVVALDAPLSLVEERIALKPDRGLALASGQTVADLYNERKALYEHYADLHCDASLPVAECVERIVQGLPAHV